MRDGYAASFDKDGMNYCIEVKGFSTQELVDLVENIFESNVSAIIELEKM